MNFKQINQPHSDTHQNIPEHTSKATLFLIAAIQLLLSLYLPITLFIEINEIILQAISIAASVLAVFAFSRIAVSKKGIISYVLILAACFMMLGTVICGLIASFVGSVYILSYMLITLDSKQSKVFAFVPTVLSYIISVLLLNNFAYAAVSLVHISAAVMLAYSFSKKLGRVSTICRTSIGIVLTFSAGAAAVFVSKYGTDLSALDAAFESLRTYCTDVLSQAFTLFYTGLEMEISSIDAAELSALIVNTLFNLLPAVIIVISNIVAFMLQSIMTSFFIRKDSSKEDVMRMMSFEMSTISAVIFLISFLIAAVLSNEISVWSATAENIAIILMPGLIYTAVFALKVLVFGKNPSCFGALLYLGCIMMFFYIPSIMFTVASLTGAVVIIVNSVKKAKERKIK